MSYIRTIRYVSIGLFNSLVRIVLETRHSNIVFNVIALFLINSCIAVILNSLYFDKSVVSEFGNHFHTGPKINKHLVAIRSERFTSRQRQFLQFVYLCNKGYSQRSIICK